MQYFPPNFPLRVFFGHKFSTLTPKQDCNFETLNFGVYLRKRNYGSLLRYEGDSFLPIMKYVYLCRTICFRRLLHDTWAVILLAPRRAFDSSLWLYGELSLSLDSEMSLDPNMTIIGTLYQQLFNETGCSVDKWPTNKAYRNWCSLYLNQWAACKEHHQRSDSKLLH